jgi:sialate O-acetylesterase
MSMNAWTNRGGTFAHLFFACLAFLSTVALRAEVSLPAIFADHMVIQRDMPVHLWGTASAGDPVTVTFRGETEQAAADSLGRWSLYLRPGAAGGPFELSVQGGNAITLKDVLVGDVWIASGQSNMEFPMAEGMNRGVNNEKEEIAAANYPRIRLLDIEPRSFDSPQQDVAIRHPWSQCSPATAATFSAVGYFFARDVQQHVDVPLGVIDVSWGGTPAEAWTGLDALSADASLMPVFAHRASLMDQLATDQLQQKREQSDYDSAKAAGKSPKPPRWHNDPAAWKPAGIYNGMVAPITPFPIKGVIWYQGESNAYQDATDVYARLFQTLIQDWRDQWAEGDFPFLFAQIANWNSGGLWPDIREAQRRALILKNTAMAVTIDIGDPIDVHPKDKQDVGLRLALAARALAYGEHIEYSGPLVRQVTANGTVLRIAFDHAESGLTSRNGDLRGFAVAGIDRKFVPAEARIEGDAVFVSAPSVTNPVYVRYGWAANPDCNLYNPTGLPASPFQAMTYHVPQP